MQRPPETDRAPRPAWLEASVVAVTILVLFVGLGSAGLWEPWETDLATLGRALAERGGWTALTHAGAPLTRAPLQPWLLGLSMAALGTSEWSARLPGALASVLLVLVVFRAGRRLFSPRAGLGAAVALLGMPLFLLQARHLLGDAPAMLGEALCVLGLARLGQDDRGGRWPLLGGALIAALASGAHGLVVPAAVGILYAAAAPTARRRVLGWSGALAAAALALGIGGALAPAGSLLAGLGYVTTPMWATPAPGTPETFDTVVKQIGYGALPWSALIPVAFGSLLFRRGEPDVPAPAADLAVAWLVAGVVAAYPGLAVGRHLVFTSLPAVALGVGALASARRPEGPGAAVLAAALAAMVWMLLRDVVSDPGRLLAGVTDGGRLEYPAAVRVPVYVRLLIVAWAAAAVAWLAVPAEAVGRAAVLLRRVAGPPRRALVAMLVLGTCATVTVAHGFTGRVSEHLSQKGVVETWRRLAGPGEPLYRYLVPKGEAEFYAGGLDDIATTQALQAAMRKPERLWVLIPSDRLPTVNRNVRQAIDRHVPVLDDSSSRLLLLSNRLDEGEVDHNPIADAIRREPPEHMDVHIAATLDDRVELLGADISAQEVRLGGSFEVTYHFAVKKRIAANWQVFAHVETGGHRLDTSSTDHYPVSGLYATNNWEPGDFIADTHTVKVPLIGSPTGTYEIYMGLFMGDTRMAVKPDSAHDGKNRIRIGRIQVQAL